jgi:hypothetical protein
VEKEEFGKRQCPGRVKEPARRTDELDAMRNYVDSQLFAAEALHAQRTQNIR